MKPGNILVGDGDRAFLSDFGVVKELTGNGTTRTGSFVGTIEYSAPEQIEGRDVDARTDVYALACVLYECLVGTPPFHRSSDVAVLNAHLHAAPPKLSKAAPDLPPDLEPVLSKALSKSPLDRYPSCGELVAAARAAAVPEPKVSRGRLALSLALLVLAAGLGAALSLLGVWLWPSSPAPPPQVTTVLEKPPPAPVSLDDLLLQSPDARTLNDTAFYLINAHEFQRALPFARKAVRTALPGTITRGYATFNLGLILLRLGRCGEALPYFKLALKIEAKEQRQYITPKIAKAKQCLKGGASAPAPSRSSGAQSAPSRGR